MKRRDFLRLAALPACLPACSLRQPPERESRRIIVIGAGLAGLAAAHELAQLGHDVTVLEARERPGGRVLTLRQPFDDGLHAEAGALFVLGGHELVLSYLTLFGLTLEPATPPFEARLLYVRGQRVVTNWGRFAVPFRLTAEEEKLGLHGMWKKYVEDAIADMDASAAAYDSMSALQFLRSRGASPEAIALLRTGHLDMMGEGIGSYSALQMLRRVAMHKSAAHSGSLTIRDGSDRLPAAFAARLGSRIRYGTPVVRLEPNERSVSVVVAAEGSRQRLSAERVICTVPFSVLRQVEVWPPFSAGKRRAIEELPYTSVARVYLQFRRRRWTEENLHLMTSTDLPVKWVFDHTINQPGRRGILEAQALGSDARRLGRMPEQERIDFALSHLEQIFPGVRADYERGASKCWDEDPWARGAFAFFPPGRLLTLTPYLAAAEGRVHFAGDHTSAWSGWAQGALESGMRAAREVAASVV